MPRRKSPFPEKPWKPDPEKWKKYLRLPELQPVKGWQLWRLDNLEDVPQDIKRR